MEILAGIFHHGVIVDDLEAAMAHFTATMGCTWTPVRAFDPMPVWNAAGEQLTAKLRVVYSHQGPLRMELIESVPGTAYDAMRALGPSHLGVWVDSVADSAEAMLADGWELVLGGAPAAQGHGAIAYLSKPGSPVIELVARAITPVMEEWWAATA
ncbi:MAG: VOC family protein [Novosphingobium sp.]|uniref:VOC family protein n=1 Tax=Novosphingobium sp. NDB2Meth1 TaxID=1892847 RepID=UPI000AB1AA13|nr:VOC family protein [Novosphingobium sp. NDB2Meth1]MBY0392487.1 VOC family protein [Novosphingobium sp.]